MLNRSMKKKNEPKLSRLLKMSELNFTKKQKLFMCFLLMEIRDIMWKTEYFFFVILFWCFASSSKQSVNTFLKVSYTHIHLYLYITHTHVLTHITSTYWYTYTYTYTYTYAHAHTHARTQTRAHHMYTRILRIPHTDTYTHEIWVPYQ